MKKNLITVGVAGVVLALGTVGGAVAGSLVTSADIKNDTIRSADVRNHTLKPRDLRPAMVERFLNQYDDSDLRAQIAALQEEVDALQGEDDNGGVNTNWDAKDGATIVDANTVRLSNVGTPAGASVEIANLDLAVQATKTIEFTYSLDGGAVYAAGTPRVFVEINGEFYNTFDANPEDAGTPNGDGTFTKTWTIPANGRVGAAGVVADTGVGTITVTDLVISGHSVKFTG